MDLVSSVPQTCLLYTSIRYLLVDEYQDTNTSQYELVKLLVGSRARFTVEMCIRDRLTVEPHTPFDAAVLAGELEEPDDDVEAAHMQIAARVLDSEGFERYEVASYARPGFACRHNIAYWTGVPYLGLGRSAATMTQNAQRRMRVKDGQVTDDLDSRQMLSLIHIS